MAELFAADFESNDFSEFTGGTDTADAGIATGTTYAINGVYGCQHDGALTAHANYAYEVTTTAGSPTVYRVAFRVNKNTVSVSSGSLIFFSLANIWPSATKVFVRAYFTSSGLTVFVRDDGGSTPSHTVGVIPAGNNTVEIRVQQATTGASNDGRYDVYLNGVLNGSQTGLDLFVEFANALNSSRFVVSCDEGGGSSLSGTIFTDDYHFRDDDTEIFPAITAFRFLGFDADDGTLMITGLKDGATLQAYTYDLAALTESGTIDSFGAATDTNLDNRTKGIFPVSAPLKTDVWYMRGRDGNSVQVQYNNRNGTLGWTDIGPGTATWGTAKYCVALMPEPTRPDDVIVAFDDNDVYRTRFGTATWVKMGDADSALRAGARHIANRFNEVLLAGTAPGTLLYTPNFGVTYSALVGGAGTATVSPEFGPAAAGDDGVVGHISTFNNSNTTLGIGVLFAENFSAFIRFPSVLIDQGETITGAYLKATPDADYGSGTVAMTIYAEDVDNGTAASSKANFDGKTRTTAGVAWNIGSLTADVQVSSPDIKAVIQEVVDRVGWVNGNALQLLVDHSSSATTKRFYAFNGTEPPVLQIEYTSTVGVINAIEVSL